MFFERKGDTITSSDISINRLLDKVVEIDSLATGDSDRDGYGEIIVGGTAGSDSHNGVLLILENAHSATEHLDDRYWLVWRAPSNQMGPTPFAVRSLALDDLDKNGKTEIITGHDLGINIYEDTGNKNSTYTLAHVITSSASYPNYASLQVDTPPTDYAPGSFYDEAAMLSSARVVQLSTGTCVMVYTTKDASLIDYNNFPSWLTNYNLSRLFYRTSLDGISWSSPERVTNDTWYGGETRFWPYYECAPSIVVTPNDAVWIAYEVKFADNPGELGAGVIEPYEWTCVTKLNTTRPERDFSRVASATFSPTIFWNSTPAENQTLGLTFLYWNNTNPNDVKLGLCRSSWNTTLVARQTTTGIPPPLLTYSSPVWGKDETQESSVGSEFVAFSQQSVLTSDGSLAVVFEGYNRTVHDSSDLHMRQDTDIWFMSNAPADASGPREWNKPRSISISANNEQTPSIAVLKGGVLAVVFKEISFASSIGISAGPRAVSYHWHVCITASMNNGSRWTTPQELQPYASTQQPYAPSISGLVQGGFMLTFHTSLSTAIAYSPAIYFAQNPLENWWRYTLGSVQCLITGDTDGDQNNEIVASSANLLYVLKLADVGTEAVYLEKWTSQPLPTAITDIAIGDINNDGINEIVVTAESGNLYAYKWLKQARALGGQLYE